MREPVAGDVVSTNHADREPLIARQGYLGRERVNAPEWDRGVECNSAQREAEAF
jgi:hypothetical protein